MRSVQAMLKLLQKFQFQGYRLGPALFGFVPTCVYAAEEVAK